jgi:hypothetical protein
MPFVNNKQPRPIGIGFGVTLMPGITPVPDEAWKKATSSPPPALKALLEDKDGGLEVVSASAADAAGADAGATTTGTPGATPQLQGGPVEVAGGPEAPGVTGGGTATMDLGTLGADDAKRLISETFDRNVLTAWRTAEKSGKNRTTVLHAIDEQLKAVKVGANAGT